MNLPTLLVLLVLAAVLAAIFVPAVRSRKKGGGGCSCGCSGCPGAGLCHPGQQSKHP